MTGVTGVAVVEGSAVTVVTAVAVLSLAVFVPTVAVAFAALDELADEVSFPLEALPPPLLPPLLMLGIGGLVRGKE